MGIQTPLSMTQRPKVNISEYSGLVSLRLWEITNSGTPAHRSPLRSPQGVLSHTPCAISALSFPGVNKEIPPSKWWPRGDCKLWHPLNKVSAWSLIPSALLSLQASFKVAFSANVKWWHSTNCYLHLPSPSPGENKLNLNKAVSFKLIQRKKPLQLDPANHKCYVGALLTQEFKRNLAFWMICILSFSGV